MKNIFENAYFGKQYKTRDGRKAIYAHIAKNDYHLLLIQDEVTSRIYEQDGRAHYVDRELDIVSEWQEPIDENELDKMAIDDILKVLNSDYYDGRISFKMVKEIYKAGYRKAMEGTEKYNKLRKLAWNMYTSMQNLSTDTTGIRKAMEEFHHFICFEEKK